MAQHTRALAGILLAVAVIAAGVPAVAFVTDSGFKIIVTPTSFANMRNLTLIGPSDVTVFRLVPGPGHVLLGGTGHFTLVDASREPPRVVWAWDVVGTANMIEYDDSWSPNWYVVSTTAGEVLAVNAKNPDFRRSYFTASRTPVVDVDVASHSGESRLAFLDSEGYLYIYNLASGSWFEIGPAPRDGPLGKLSGYTVNSIAYPRVSDGTGNYTAEPRRLAVLLQSAPTTSVVAYAYYLVDDKEQPAIKKEEHVNVTINGTEVEAIERRTLYYGLVLADYKILLSLKEGNITINETDVPATKLRIFAAYVIELLDATTQEVLSQECYYTLSPVIQPEPGKTFVYGKLILDGTGESLEDCISKAGIDVNPEGPYQVSFSPVMVVDTLQLPKPAASLAVGGDAWIVYYPYPGALAPVSGASIWKVYMFDSPPAGWPAAANALVLAAVDRYLYIYVTDYSLVPKRIGTDSKYVEVVDLGAQAMSVAVSPDGERIVAGTASGKVVLLEWSSDLQRYIAKWSLQVDTGPVTSVSYLIGDYVLAATSNGRLQLIAATGDTWYPVWRGPYGYEGVETNVAGIAAEAVSTDLIAAGPSPLGSSIRTPTFFLLRIASPDIVRVTVEVKVKKSVLGGNATFQPPPGGVMEVYTAQGDLVAKAPLQEGAFTVYVEAGSYRLVLRVPGLGQLEKDVQASFPEYRDVIEAGYREVKVEAIVPPAQKGERYPPNVSPGPLSGAMVVATPVQVAPDLGYKLEPRPVYAVTGDDGTAVLLLWEGVSYNITVSKPGFRNYTVQIDPYGPVRVKAILKPVAANKTQEKAIVRLYDVRIQVVDDRGQPISLARVEVYYANNNTLVASLFTDNQGVAMVRLREGTYLVRATADGYMEKQAVLSVPQTTNTVISLDPTTATKVKRMIPYILAIAGILVLIGIVYAMRERIARRLAEEAEYF